MNRYLRAGLIALVTTTLLFGRQIANFSSSTNRYFWTWSRTDAAIIVGLILGISLIGLGIYALVHAINRPWLSRIMGFVWIFFLAIGAISNMPRIMEVPSMLHLIWMAALLGLFVASVMKPKFRLVEWCGNVCIFFSFLPAILLIQVLMWKPWTSPKETYKPTAGKADATPVFIFSFDAMAWPYMSQNNQIKKELPNLRAFTEQAYRFPHSISAATTTQDSLPRMVYQLDSPFRVQGVGKPQAKTAGDTYFLVKGKPINTKELPSIFNLAHKAGYQSAMVTFYLPWRKILQNQGNYVHVYPEEPHGDGLIEQSAFTLLRNLRYYPYPNTDVVWKKIYASLYSQNWARINSDMQAETMQIIKNSPASTLGFFHFPLPHGPFIFNPDGSYRGPYKSRISGTATDYMRNLRYADLVIGKFIQTLKESGKYDQAMIIITSDHGWMTNKRGPNSETILPRNALLIKIPNQTEGFVMPEKVKNTSLKNVIQTALQGKLTDTTFRQEIAKAAIPGPATRPTTKPR